MRPVEVSLGGTPIFVQPSRVDAVISGGRTLSILLMSGQQILIPHKADGDMDSYIREVVRQIWGDPKDPYRTEGNQ